MSSRPSIRLRDQPRADALRVQLEIYEQSHGPLAGLHGEPMRSTFIAQLIDSERRVEFVQRLKDREISDTVLESIGRTFDPLRGALLMARRGEHDEACWLVFLSAHFARNRRTEWKLAGDFYNRLGAPGRWSWLEVTSDPPGVSSWLDANRAALSAAGGRFGNHRKYESLSGAGTGQAIETYVSWVGASHEALFDGAATAQASRRERFGSLYRSMAQVARFGRVGRFDYLTMLYKLELANIEPDTCHLDSGATGPRIGAKLLLHGAANASAGIRTLEAQLNALGDALEVTPDVLEDALCNWQKSPVSYVFFGG